MRVDRAVTAAPPDFVMSFEVVTATVMNVAIFWDIAPCTSYMDRRFGGRHHTYLQGRQETSVLQVAGLGSSSAVYRGDISDTFLRNVGTQRYIPEDVSIGLNIHL
jgi:hypothetical protein